MTNFRASSAIQWIGASAQARQGGVAAGPGDDVLGGVDVDDFGPGRGGGQRAPARVGKQVQHAHRRRGGDLLGDPRPVGGLLGKQAQVAENGPLQLQHQRPMADGPLLGQFAAAGPLPLGPFAAVEAGVGQRPGGRVRPRDLLGGRTGPIQRHLPKTLQPPAFAEVEQFVLIGSEHCRFHFSPRRPRRRDQALRSAGR